MQNFKCSLEVFCIDFSSKKSSLWKQTFKILENVDTNIFRTVLRRNLETKLKSVTWRSIMAMYFCNGRSYWRRLCIIFLTCKGQNNSWIILNTYFLAIFMQWTLCIRKIGVKTYNQICSPETRYRLPEAHDWQPREEEDHASSGHPFPSDWRQDLYCSADHATMCIHCIKMKHLYYLITINTQS